LSTVCRDSRSSPLPPYILTSPSIPCGRSHRCEMDVGALAFKKGPYVKRRWLQTAIVSKTVGYRG
jgi:hypothetical protein